MTKQTTTFNQARMSLCHCVFQDIGKTRNLVKFRGLFQNCPRKYIALFQNRPRVNSQNSFRFLQKVFRFL